MELEFDVAVTRTRGGQAGVQFWVVTLGGKVELGHATTQRIKVTLQPVNPETGEDARIADARRGGRRPPDRRRSPAAADGVGGRLQLARRWRRHGCRPVPGL